MPVTAFSSSDFAKLSVSLLVGTTEAEERNVKRNTVDAMRGREEGREKCGKERKRVRRESILLFWGKKARGRRRRHGEMYQGISEVGWLVDKTLGPGDRLQLGRHPRNL